MGQAIPNPLIIKEFAVLDRQFRWRIDWLGDVHKSGSNNAQHMIDVFLSPLWPDMDGFIVDPQAADTDRQVLIAVGVGYLPILHIGALFRAGKPIPLRPERSERLRLNVLPALGQFITLDKPITRYSPKYENRKPVMPSEFSLGPRAWRSGSNAQLLAMPDLGVNDAYYVMIPSIEVIRFFFCSSSLLSRSLFGHGWEDLIWKKKCDTTALPHHIVVGLETKKGLRLTDARHLAFKLASTETAEAINLIRQSLQATNSAHRARTPLSCKFPFEDDTEIQAEVVKIPTGTALGERYLVTRLLKCKRPIPFEICYAHPMLHPGQGDNRDDDDLKAMSIGIAQRDEKHADITVEGHANVVVNIDELLEKGEMGDGAGAPASNLEDAVIPQPDDRFIGLMEVPTALTRKSEQEYRSAGGKKALPILGEGLSTATPRGAKPIVPTNIETDPLVASSDPTITLLREAIPYLQALGYVVSEEPPQFLASAKTDKHRAKSWANIECGVDFSGKQKYRSRLLVAIQIGLSQGSCVVAEIERRSGDHFGLAVFYLEPGWDVDTFLGELAVEVVKRRGWPRYFSQSSLYALDKSLENCVAGDRGIHVNIDTPDHMANMIDRIIRRRHSKRELE